MKMKQNEADRMVKNLLNKFDLPLKATLKASSNSILVVIEPEGVHPHEGFAIHIESGWRSLYIDYVPGKFARDLVDQMAASNREQKAIFSHVAKHIIEERASLVFKINGFDTDPMIPEKWPVDWRSFHLSLKKSPLEINTDDHALSETLINLWVERFFGCVMALSPVEKLNQEALRQGLPEGALTSIRVNRYERSRYNRNICINFHGPICKVCLASFEERYGEIGKGFIHVHHLVPVSRIGPDYLIDPVKDLVPVCPNCHAMLHTREIPYSVEELKFIISSL
jgi:5-methylcytosine-specific restriction protein A